MNNPSVERLIAAGLAPTQAKVFAPILADVFDHYGIITDERQAAFLAQAMHESGGFTVMEENLYYSRPERIASVFKSRVRSLEDAATLARNPQALANRVYSNRLGNGDEASGDGWRYRGRGIFQITGRANYESAGFDMGQPYVARPELVAQPRHAAFTAGWYWDRARLNDLADRGDIDGITRAINGPAMLGRQERAEVYVHALEAWSSGAVS